MLIGPNSETQIMIVDEILGIGVRASRYSISTCGVNSEPGLDY